MEYEQIIAEAAKASPLLIIIWKMFGVDKRLKDMVVEVKELVTEKNCHDRREGCAGRIVGENKLKAT